jgi:RNA-directed DNA polymerase
MIKKPDRLAYLLNSDLTELNYLLENIDRYYYEKKELKLNYDGSPRLNKGQPQYRIMNPSKGRFKQVQTRIKNKIFPKFTFPVNVQGSIKEKDNITNAKIHKGKKYHLCTDLSNFYPSVTSNLVYEMFIALSFSPDVSRLLTKLTTYTYILPQGTPTSPYIANLVFIPFDEILIKKCEENNIYYSRYVDDLTFSSQSDFKGMIDSLLKIIHQSPFKINHKKTFYKIGKTVITGIVTKNNVLDARDDQKQKLKNENLTELQKKSLKNYIDRVKKG